VADRWCTLLARRCIVRRDGWVRVVATPERARAPAARVALDGEEAREKSWGDIEDRAPVNADVAEMADA
jgi:hypothetical protein